MTNGEIAVIWHPDSDMETLISPLCTSPTLQTTTKAIKMVAEMDKKKAAQLARYFLKNKSTFIVLEPRHQWEGSNKIVFKGALPTANEVFKVAFSQTKSNSLWNKNEMLFLQSQLRRPIPGVVDVFLLSHNTSTFIAVHPLYDCDLFTFILQNRNALSRKQTYAIQKQLLKSVYELHKRGIVHRDVKPQNFFVASHSDSTYSVVIGDLALSLSRKLNKELATTQKISNFAPGSAPFLAPEYADLCIDLEGKIPVKFYKKFIQRTSLKIDIWGLGLIFLLLENESLFHDIVPVSQTNSSSLPYIQTYRQYYKKGNIALFPQPKEKNSIIHLIWEMLQPDPKRRISSKRAMEKINTILPEY